MILKGITSSIFSLHKSQVLIEMYTYYNIRPSCKPLCGDKMTGTNGTHKVPGKGGVWGGVWEWRGLEYPGPPREVRVPPLDPRPGKNGSRSSQDPGSALGEQTHELIL